jgi:hypothetical protein
LIVSAAGAVYIYKKGTSWPASPDYELAGNPVASALFGLSVDLNYDGSLVIAGAPGDSGGRAFLFNGSSNYARVGNIIKLDSGAADDNFGIAVSLSSDGAHAAVGAFGLNEYSGSSFIYHTSSQGWALSGEYANPHPLSQDFFGSSVALSSGTSPCLAVGAKGVPYKGVAQQGVVYLFKP